MDIQKLLAAFTLRQKIAYCTGADSWHTRAFPGLGIPAVKMADGPHGLRCQEGKGDMLGVNASLPATCFPTAVTSGAAWDPELLALEGEAIGREALAAGVSLILGPGCNIKRSPLGGRNFEYFSEDPYLSGKLAAGFIRGQQATGAGSCLKHFAANSQETDRQTGNSQMDERTLREIYLSAFEIAVKESSPAAVMCAYNQLNGTFASDHKTLLTDILRTEWGFSGLVVTDWGAMHDRVEAFRAGCDLNMPGGSRYMHKAACRAVRKGELSEGEVDRSVSRLLRLVEKAQAAPKAAADFAAHHDLALRIAREGAVLLKNEDDLLPLAAEDAVLIGHMAAHLRYQGSGSSHINPTRLVSLTDALPDALWLAGCDGRGGVTEESLAEAVKAAKAKKIAVVVAGLPESYESEGFDRAHMSLPRGHDRLIEAVAEANPNTVVVLLGGSPMELPWKNRVKAILYMGLPGQAGGQAIADLLTGKANPGGKLTESWPESLEDTPCRETFATADPQYREGIYIGYRYYDKAETQVAYPFGFGLSYTSFAYSQPCHQGDSVEVTVKNTGSLPGAEVVQLYIAPPRDGIYRPLRELKGFQKVFLQPGEEKTVRFSLDGRSFAVWQDGWVVPAGSYEIQLASSSRDIRCRIPLQLQGEQPVIPAWQAGSWYEAPRGLPSKGQWELLMGGPVAENAPPARGSYTMDSTIDQMQADSRLMGFLYRLMYRILTKPYPDKMEDPTCRMIVVCATRCPIRALVINGKGFLTDTMAKGLVRLANGRKRGAK